MKNNSEINKTLEKLAGQMALSENHLGILSKEKDRLGNFSLKGGGIFYDFSRQRVNKDIMKSLTDLSRNQKVKERFKRMVSGDRINISEKRAALHTALRSDNDVIVDGRNISEDIKTINADVKEFSSKVRCGNIKGTTGKPFEYIVVVGIGGSLLGTEFVYTALENCSEKVINTYFLGGVDIENFKGVVKETDPERTLWIVISKSFSTVETLSNLKLITDFLKNNNLNANDHIVTISNNEISKRNCLKSFTMFDFVGGRYSVTSVVGVVPISIALGYKICESFLKGAFEMDQHAENEEEHRNLPLISALLSIWNNHYLGYNTIGIIPYSARLKAIVPHLQQLSMESNGKSVDVDGNPVKVRTGTILFGYQGTDAQHSFFQLAHQGQPFPIEFIGVVKPYYDENDGYLGVTTHQELWANMISQAKALAEGRASDKSFRVFEGNRPSSTILIESVSPENIGRLLSFFEAKTVYEAFLMNINPFDQFGVELGKTNAESIREEIRRRNKGSEKEKSDNIENFYIDTLFSEKF